jgi:hypothetical protein
MLDLRVVPSGHLGALRRSDEESAPKPITCGASTQIGGCKIRDLSDREYD